MPSLVSQYPLLQDEALTLLVTRHLKVNPRLFPLLPMFPRRVFNSDTLTWDILKGSRGMARITLENAESPTAPKEVVSKGSATPMVIKVKDQLDSETLSFLRNPGMQHIVDANASAQAKIARKAAALNSLRLYRKHWAMASALQGSLAYSEGGVNISINYGLTTLTPPSTAWTNTSATIPSDIDAAIEEFTATADTPPTLALLNRATMAMMRKNDNISTFFDAPGRREELIAGFVTGLNGIDWRVVDGRYTNDSGTLTKWLPDGLIIFITPGMEGDEPTMAWGSARTYENDFTGGVRASSYETTDPRTVWLRIYENGIPIYFHPERVQLWDVNG